MAKKKRVPQKGIFFAVFALGVVILCFTSCTSAPPRIDADGYRAFSSDRVPIIPDEARAHIRERKVFLPLEIEQDAQWETLACGLAILEWKVPKNNIHNFALKIDLAYGALEITSYPQSIGGGGVFAAKTAQTFARETGAAVVINATPFEMPAGFLSKKRALTSVYALDGVPLAPPVARYAALGFLRDNSAFMLKSQSQLIPQDSRIVAGGFFSILEEGALVTFKAVSLNARMAVGISKDKKTLYILCVKGADGVFARGMSYEECALVLFLLGAENALQMDGGSSTSLVVNGKTLAGQFGVTPANLLGFKF